MKSMERYERLLTRKGRTKDLDAARGLLQLHKHGGKMDPVTYIFIYQFILVIFIYSLDWFIYLLLRYLCIVIIS